MYIHIKLSQLCNYSTKIYISSNYIFNVNNTKTFKCFIHLTGNLV